MAKLIQKCGYIKAGGGSAYMKYIATREGVEIIECETPATKKQQELILNLLHDFPDADELFEYKDYLDKPTAQTASAFIAAAIDRNAHSIQDSDIYMKYIATRPRAEKHGGHGLFGAENHGCHKAASPRLTHLSRTGGDYQSKRNLHRFAQTQAAPAKASRPRSQDRRS